MAHPFDEPSVLLRQRGLRPTGPRRRLLAFLQAHPGHLTPAEILEGLRQAGTPLSIATLYQNLAAFTRHGLIKRVVGPDGAVRYDVNLLPHHHLICDGCGRIVDVELPDPVRLLQPIAARTPPPAARARAADDPADVRGWKVTAARVELRGLCPACLARSSHDSHEPASR